MRKIIILILILLLSIPIVFSASISTNNKDYHPGDTVFISGKGFPSNIDVIIQINDPADTVKFIDQIRTEDDGKFSTTYVIASDAMSGSYTIYASGGGTQAQGNFTVSSTSITTTIPPGDNRGGGNDDRRTTITTITSETTTTILGGVTTTTQIKTTTSTLGVSTTTPEAKRTIINSRTTTIIGVATIVPIILFFTFMKRLGGDRLNTNLIYIRSL